MALVQGLLATLCWGGSALSISVHLHPSVLQPDPGHLRVPLPDPQRSNGLPDAEEGAGEPSSAPAAEPVRFGWVKGVMVSAPRPAGES